MMNISKIFIVGYYINVQVQECIESMHYYTFIVSMHQNSLYLNIQSVLITIIFHKTTQHKDIFIFSYFEPSR